MDTPHLNLRRARPRIDVRPDSPTIESNVVLRSGREMPLLGFGTRMLTSHTANAVQRALGLGYRMVDTAADYMTQPGIGSAMRRVGSSRDSLFITIKVDETEDGYAATARNLAQLELAHADLVLIHRAPDKGVGEDAWCGLMRARDAGLTRDIGVCGYKISQLRELAEATGEMPAVHQVEWSPFGHSHDMLNFCRAHGIALQAAAPLTRGKRLRDERLGALARKLRRSPAQIILRWNLQKGVVPIPKANLAGHQRENLDIFDFALDAIDMARLDGLNEHFSALGRLEYLSWSNRNGARSG